MNYSTNNETDISKNIDITIEEKATGEISAGAGTGTTGSSLNAGIRENNYLGLGIKLDVLSPNLCIFLTSLIHYVVL